MQPITEVIRKRVSCRTYTEQPLPEEILREISSLIEKLKPGPFGNKPRLELINTNMTDPGQGKKLGTYGIIKNARHFIAGAIKDAPKAMEDFGYCVELLILQATALGLGTCWLGGTFSSSSFAKTINLQPDELLPAVSPLGYPASEKSFTERVMRTMAKADRRKPWEYIFFTDNFAQPLTEEQAGAYAPALASVRLAPSASNKQPWRILRDDSTDSFHFYLSRARGYNFLRGVSLQDIDMGIATCHFELTAQEQGLTGKWLVDDDAPKSDSFDYIVSWRETKSRV